jgi:hypothetical protein
MKYVAVAAEDRLNILALKYCLLGTSQQKILPVALRPMYTRKTIE